MRKTQENETPSKALDMIADSQGNLHTLIYRPCKKVKATILEKRFEVEKHQLKHWLITSVMLSSSHSIRVFYCAVQSTG